MCLCSGSEWAYFNTGTKCNSLTQQFIGISTTIDTWATDLILQSCQVHFGIPSAYYVSIGDSTVHLTTL